jgi:hypothetical protein
MLFPFSSTTLTLTAPEQLPLAVKVNVTCSPCANVLLLGRLVSPVKVFEEPAVHGVPLPPVLPVPPPPAVVVSGLVVATQALPLQDHQLPAAFS